MVDRCNFVRPSTSTIEIPVIPVKLRIVVSNPNSNINATEDYLAKPSRRRTSS
jgi:hypothetical protein